jgi:hypothetical protein
VSDYDYEEAPYEPGIDTGSIGRDEYGYYDPNAVVQDAAGLVYQGLDQTYGPLVSDHDQRLQNVEQLTAGMLAARDMTAAREQHAADEQLAAEATRLAEQRLDAAFEPGWFKKNGENLRQEIEARPGLLPDAVLEGGPQGVADALEMAARKIYAESAAALRQQRDAQNAADLAQMQSALDREHGMRQLLREFKGKR